MSQLTLIIGRRGSGKSTTLLEIAQGLDRPTIIVDPGQAKAYTQAGIGFITPEQIPEFSRGGSTHGRIVRISNIIHKKALISKMFGFGADGIIRQYQAFTNGNLILEDAGSYINSSMPEALLECVKAFKQYGLNLYLSYHTIREVSTKILDLEPEYLILKKTGDVAVWSKIVKAKNLPNQGEAMKAYYQASVYGMTPAQIVNHYGIHLDGVARDLALRPAGDDPKKKLAIAKQLSRMAHGREIPSKAQIAMMNYQPFVVKLRL